jgi:Ca2+-binding EF-hand superfamily protein
MTLLLAVAAGVITLATPAADQPKKPPAPPAKLVFLSPSGEPFRPTPSAPDPLKTWFDQVDVKRQGYIDRGEFRADAARFFKKLDENGDGVIDGFEVADYENKIVPELANEAVERMLAAAAEHPSKRRGGEESHHGERRTEPSPSSAGDHNRQARQQGGIQQLIGEPEPVSGADFNFDSHITLAEWMTATDQRFEILDQAKTGKLTLDELRARFKPIKTKK